MYQIANYREEISGIIKKCKVFNKFIEIYRLKSIIYQQIKQEL